jgi:hypothetical protein
LRVPAWAAKAEFRKWQEAIEQQIETVFSRLPLNRRELKAGTGPLTGAAKVLISSDSIKRMVKLIVHPHADNWARGFWWDARTSSGTEHNVQNEAGDFYYCPFLIDLVTGDLVPSDDVYIEGKTDQPAPDPAAATQIRGGRRQGTAGRDSASSQAAAARLRDEALNFLEDSPHSLQTRGRPTGPRTRGGRPGTPDLSNDEPGQRSASPRDSGDNAREGRHVSILSTRVNTRGLRSRMGGHTATGAIPGAGFRVFPEDDHCPLRDAGIDPATFTNRTEPRRGASRGRGRAPQRRMDSFGYRRNLNEPPPRQRRRREQSAPAQQSRWDTETENEAREYGEWDDWVQQDQQQLEEWGYDDAAEYQ